MLTDSSSAKANWNRIRKYQLIISLNNPSFLLDTVTMFQSKTNSIFKFEDQLRVELIIIYILYICKKYLATRWRHRKGKVPFCSEQRNTNSNRDRLSANLSASRLSIRSPHTSTFHNWSNYGSFFFSFLLHFIIAFGILD